MGNLGKCSCLFRGAFWAMVRLDQVGYFAFVEVVHELRG